MSDAHARETLVKHLILMKEPTRLLKFGSSGKPKFHFFRFDESKAEITWESQTKSADQTRIALSDVIEVRFGQRTPKFTRNRRKDLEHLSFSIIFEKGGSSAASSTSKATVTGLQIRGDSLDLVVTDDREFRVWAETLMAVVKMPPGQRADLLREVATFSATTGTRSQKTLSRADAPHLMHQRSDTTMSSAMLQEQEQSNDVYSFGANKWGQTGLKSEFEKAGHAKLVESLLGKGVVQIAAGWSHTVVLLEKGTVLQCGNRLATGLEDDSFAPLPTAITDKIGVITIACGAFHTAAVTEKGEVLAWGCGYHGQLGLGHQRDVTVPTHVASLNAVVAEVECGSDCTAALTTTGTLYTWGKGAHGALGHNDTADVYAPKIVSDLNGEVIQKIAVGSSFMVASTDQQSYSWGWNACGQLGLGHADDQLRPHVISPLGGLRVLHLACGAAHVIAIVTAHKKFGQASVLYAWGSNANGQLGIPSTQKCLKPSIISTFQATPVEVSCGDLHTMVRDSDGNVWGCGSNHQGQLSLTVANNINVLMLLPAFKEKTCRSVMCGGEHTCILTERQWVDDKEAKDCMSCKTPFTTFNRRHHCRNCFGVFCGSCSDYKITVLKTGKTEPQRVCKECYQSLSGR